MLSFLSAYLSIQGGERALLRVKVSDIINVVVDTVVVVSLLIRSAHRMEGEGGHTFKKKVPLPPFKAPATSLS